MTGWVATCTEDTCDFRKETEEHYAAVEAAVEHRVEHQTGEQRHDWDISDQ